MNNNEFQSQLVQKLKEAIAENIKKRKGEKRNSISFYIQNIGVIGSLLFSLAALIISILALLKR